MHLGCEAHFLSLLPIAGKVKEIYSHKKKNETRRQFVVDLMVIMEIILVLME